MERSGGDAQLEQEAAAKEAAEGAVAPAGGRVQLVVVGQWGSGR